MPELTLAAFKTAIEAEFDQGVKTIICRGTPVTKDCTLQRNRDFGVIFVTHNDNDNKGDRDKEKKSGDKEKQPPSKRQKNK
jgi:hypothetical protein